MCPSDRTTGRMDEEAVVHIHKQYFSAIKDVASEPAPEEISLILTSDGSGGDAYGDDLRSAGLVPESPMAVIAKAVKH